MTRKSVFEVDGDQLRNHIVKHEAFKRIKEKVSKQLMTALSTSSIRSVVRTAIKHKIENMIYEERILHDSVLLSAMKSEVKSIIDEVMMEPINFTPKEREKIKNMARGHIMYLLTQEAENAITNIVTKVNISSDVYNLVHDLLDEANKKTRKSKN